MISPEKFILDYNESLKLYKINKKHFFIINLLYTKYAKDNIDIDDEIKKAKLNKIINTYIVQQKHNNFSKDIYFKCCDVWSGISKYLDVNIWLTVNFLEDNSNINSKLNAEKYYNNIVDIIEILSLKNIKIYGNSIQGIVRKLKSEIGV